MLPVTLKLVKVYECDYAHVQQHLKSNYANASPLKTVNLTLYVDTMALSTNKMVQCTGK